MNIHETRLLIAGSDNSTVELPGWRMAEPIKQDPLYQAALADHAWHARRLEMLAELAERYRIDQARDTLTEPRALEYLEPLLTDTRASLARAGGALERAVADAGERAFGRRPHVTALCCWSADGYETELPAAA